MQKHHIIFSLLVAFVICIVVLVMIGHNKAEAPNKEAVTMDEEINLNTSTTSDDIATSTENNRDKDLSIPTTPVKEKPPTLGTTPPLKPQGCVVSGCSRELCTEEGNDVASICIWREEFACYKNATCERQSNGQCGWSETNELNACLTKAQENEVLPQ